MLRIEEQEPIDVSVIIPVRDEVQNIASCLGMILEQEADLNGEILVIDSGSTDGTPEVVRGFPGVRLLTVSPEDFGHGRTRNLGARHARGNMLVFLNADALPVDRRWLGPLVDTVRTDTEVAGVFSRHLPREDCHLYMKRDLERTMPEESRIINRRNPVDFFFFSTVSCLIPRSVWRRYPFEDDIDIAEDQSWARQVLEEGFKIVYESDSRVCHSHNYSIGQLYRIKKRIGRSEGRFRRRLAAVCLGLPLVIGGIVVRWTGDIAFILRQPLTLRRRGVEAARALMARKASFLGRFMGWIAR